MARLLVRSVLLLSASTAVLFACGDDKGQGGGGAAGDGGGNAGGHEGGGGGANPCSACDQLCVIQGCADPSYRCEPGNGNCDGPPSGPVCGCDGETIEGDFGYCEAADAHLAIGDTSACQTGTFACGTEACVRNAEICVETSGGAEPNQTYECRPLSDIQGFCSSIPDCNCIDTSSLGCGGACDCTSDADHQETIHIALP